MANLCNEEKCKIVLDEYFIKKEEFKSEVECIICKLNKELGYSIEFKSISEIEIFDWFLQYSLLNLDIDKKRFENSNFVGGQVNTIFISLFTTLLANVFLSKIDILNKVPYINTDNVITKSIITVVLFVVILLIIHQCYLKTFDKNNQNIITASQKYNNAKLIHIILKSKYKIGGDSLNEQIN